MARRMHGPVAVREVLLSGIGVSLATDGADSRLVVRSSSAVITPREVLLRPIRVGRSAMRQRLLAVARMTILAGGLRANVDTPKDGSSAEKPSFEGKPHSAKNRTPTPV